MDTQLAVRYVLFGVKFKKCQVNHLHARTMICVPLQFGKRSVFEYYKGG